MSEEDTHLSEGAEAPEEGFDLSHYAQVLRKRMWIIAAIVAVGVTAMVLYTMRLPKIYQASASVVMISAAVFLTSEIPSFPHV